jgi:hypothetical protein
MEPLGWTMTVNGNYLCMCGDFKTSNLEDIQYHLSTNLGEGYCVRGLRCIAKDKYECICGDTFYEKKGYDTPRDLAFDHVWRQLNGVADGKCITKHNNTCKKCNITLKTPAALNLHYKSKSHLNFETKVDLYCKVCNIRYYGQKQMLTHLETNKHKKLAMFHS